MISVQQAAPVVEVRPADHHDVMTLLWLGDLERFGQPVKSGQLLQCALHRSLRTA